MTASERRSSLGLALIFALRMLGLFLVVPVFPLAAASYEGATAANIGLAMGIYGLTQALLHLPLGMASDRFGRKRLITLGMLVFAAGCVVAALATSIDGLLIGRALQGAGAVSAAVTALLADLTRDEVRTKAMAIIGGSIGLVFSLALVISPLLAGWIGLSGMFWLVAVLALLGIGGLYLLVPEEPVRLGAVPSRGSLWQTLQHPALLRLNAGVFVLHAVQLAMWMVVPALLVQAGLEQPQHWQVYLPAVLGSFVLMGALLFRMERAGKLRLMLQLSMVLILLVQLALWWINDQLQGEQLPALWQLAVLLLVFFTGFNILEASQPSLVSRQAPEQLRGMALGAYNTVQSLGLFVGGAVGGFLLKQDGPVAVTLACIALMLLWLMIAWNMPVPARAHAKNSRK